MKVTFNILMPNKANLSKKHTQTHDNDDDDDDELA